MPALPDGVAVQIARELESARHGERGPIVSGYALAYGVSPATIYRTVIQKGGMKRGRKVRADKGQSAKYPDAEVCRLWALIEKIRKMQGDGEPIPVTRVVEALEKNGYIEKGRWKPNSLNRRFRDLGLGRPVAARRFQAGWANHWHQVDFSGSKYFAWAGEKDCVVVRKSQARSRINKNDPGERFRLWYTGCVDDYSRVKSYACFLAPGADSAFRGLTSLSRIWSRQGNREIQGTPDGAYTDNGGFRKAAATAAFCAAAEIEIASHLPYNSRASGKVERQWRELWYGFEAPFVLRMGEVIHIDEIRRALAEWTREENERAHPCYRTDRRIDLYNRSLLNQGGVRVLPENALQYSWKTETRKVHAGEVQFEGDRLGLPEEKRNLWEGRKVEILVNVLGEVKIVGPDGEGVTPIAPQILDFGSFHGERKSDAERMVEAAQGGWIGTDLTRHLTDKEADAKKRETGNVLPLTARRKEVGMANPFYEEPEEYENEEAAYAAFLRRAGLGAGEVSEREEALLRAALRAMEFKRVKVMEMADEAGERKAKEAIRKEAGTHRANEKIRDAEADLQAELKAMSS